MCPTCTPTSSIRSAAEEFGLVFSIILIALFGLHRHARHAAAR
jgi:hypothetical protein